MGGEEKMILGPASFSLRVYDVLQARYRDFGLPSFEETPSFPHLLEVEPLHHQGEIDLLLAEHRTSRRSVLYYFLSQPEVHRFAEGFTSAR